MASEVGSAIAELLGALDEPLPPAGDRGDRHLRSASARKTTASQKADLGVREIRRRHETCSRDYAAMKW
jgi:hypothetical protein